MVTENESEDIHGKQSKYELDDHRTSLKQHTEMANSFYEEIRSICDLIQGVSKVNEIRTGDASVIVFQIGNSSEGKGENYVTLDDGCVLLNNNLQQNGYTIPKRVEEFVRNNINVQKMKEVDNIFENKELEVIPLKSFTKAFFIDLLKISNKLAEKIHDGKNKTGINDYTINFKNCRVDDSLLKDDSRYDQERETNMFSDVDVSDDIKKNRNGKNLKNLIIRGDEYMHYMPPSRSNQPSINEAKNDLLNLNVKDGVIPEEYDNYIGDWNNNIVGEDVLLFEPDDISTKINHKIFKEIDGPDRKYNQHMIQDEHFFSEKSQHQSLNLNLMRASTKNSNQQTRPFICHFRNCNRAFKRFEHLKRHYRIHTGERPFKCKFPGCHKSFARSDNLNQHLRVHNNGSSGINEGRQFRYLDDEN